MNEFTIDLTVLQEEELKSGYKPFSSVDYFNDINYFNSYNENFTTGVDFD